MRVLFTIPSNPNRHITSPDGMPLGALYLASMIRNQHDVKVVDEYSFPEDENIENAIFEFNPDIIAISIPFKTLERSAKDLINKIRTKTDSKIIIGGIHATLALERVTHNFNCDYIIPGESEYIFRDFINFLDSKKNLSKSENIVLEGKIVRRHGCMTSAIDEIPFPSREFLRFRERYMERILTSRGCGFSCAFCSSKKFWGDFRGRNVDNIIDEMITIYNERGTVPISFADDSFTFDRKRVVQFCESLKKRDVKTYGLGFSSHPSRLDNELLDMMRSVGFDSIFLGLESGSDEILKRISKTYDHKKVEKLIGYAKTSGYKIHASFMIGLPGESKSDIETTFRWADNLSVQSIGFHVFYPFEGCPIRENPEKYGIRILEKPYNEGDIDGEAVIHNGVLSPDEILDYYYRARKIAKLKQN